MNYQQLTIDENPILVLDIAALSDKDLASYCLDISRASDNGLLAELSLRVLFNGLLQDDLASQYHRCLQMPVLLKQIN